MEIPPISFFKLSSFHKTMVVRNIITGSWVSLVISSLCQTCVCGRWRKPIWWDLLSPHDEFRRHCFPVLVSLNEWESFRSFSSCWPSAYPLLASNMTHGLTARALRSTDWQPVVPTYWPEAEKCYTFIQRHLIMRDCLSGQQIWVVNLTGLLIDRYKLSWETTKWTAKGSLF